MMTAHDIANALYGLKRVLRMDAQAVKHFGDTADAFWGSFWVAAWVAPVYILQSILAYLRTPDSTGFLPFALVEVFTYIIGWVLFPLIMIRVSDWLGRWPTYFRYITMYNWFNVVIAVALLPAVIFGGFGLLPDGMVALYFIAITVGFLVYGWWIAVHGLAVSGSTAVGLVMLDGLLSLVSMRLTSLMVGM